jgi:nucleotide-binding universal stress UspA family protein
LGWRSLADAKAGLGADDCGFARLAVIDLDQTNFLRRRADWTYHPDIHHEAETSMFRRILVPTDGSVLSERAAAAAVALARGSGAEIVALSMATPLPLCDGNGNPEALAAQRAGHVARLAEEAGVPHSQVTSAPASQHEEIIRVALQRHCDLIFIAAHGQCDLTRLIAGRVPQLVLAYSPLPVILYRSATAPA